MILPRRTFLKSTSAIAIPWVHGFGNEGRQQRQFRLWACGDSHVGTDLKKKRESLAEAIRQSEFGGDEGGPAFDWDIAVHVGDLSGNQGSPDDEEGREVIKQFSALTKHRREDVYNLAGNHDASGPGEETQWWFRKWVDPTGENTKSSGVDAARRKFPVEGTWERYSFRVGNLLFLIMSDRNDGGPPRGRAKRGGYPAGAVTSDTFDWWKRLVMEIRIALFLQLTIRCCARPPSRPVRGKVFRSVATDTSATTTATFQRAVRKERLIYIGSMTVRTPRPSRGSWPRTRTPSTSGLGVTLTPILTTTVVDVLTLNGSGM